MEIICAGSNCKKAKDCERYWQNAEDGVEYMHTDYSVLGDYTSTNDGESARIVAKCGDRGGYKLFEEKDNVK